MTRSNAFLGLCATAALLAASNVTHADTLRRQVQRETRMDLPQRGLSMAQVEKRFGAPERKLPVRGGGSRWQPPIHRWVYPGYIVYFEHKIVIHSVADVPVGEHPVR
jgi:hypothetical protein